VIRVLRIRQAARGGGAPHSHRQWGYGDRAVRRW